jgi:hypothetical protein
MHPASPGDNSPASPSGIIRNPSEVLADLVAALPVAFDDEPPCDAEDLAVVRSAVEACQAYAADLAATLATRLTELDIVAATLPGSPRWTRTAAALRDAADAEGYDFDAYGDDPSDGYSGRGMFGREVPALTLDEHDEAVVVAHAFRKATGVRASVDSLGLGFVVYPSRLVD